MLPKYLIEQTTNGMLTLIEGELPLNIPAPGGAGQYKVYAVSNETTDVMISAQPLPANVTPPSLTGDGEIGASLIANPGSWTDADIVIGQWLRDDEEIPGATTTVYVPTSADDTHLLRYRETASNASGSSTALSADITARYAPPQATGTLFDEIFDQYSGDQIIATGQAFSGDGLQFSVTGPGAFIEAATGMLTLSTDTALNGADVIVQASNSGGSANQSFQVTVEEADEIYSDQIVQHGLPTDNVGLSQLIEGGNGPTALPPDETRVQIDFAQAVDGVLTFWMQGVVYYDGVNWSRGNGIMAFHDSNGGTQAFDESYFNCVTCQASGRLGAAGSQRATTAYIPDPTTPGFYVCTSRFKISAGSVKAKHWFGGTAAAEVSRSRSTDHTLSDLDQLFIGNTGAIPLNLFDVCWGYGDPEGVHDFTQNPGGEIRNILDYDFDASSGLTLENHWPCHRADDGGIFGEAGNNHFELNDTVKQADDWNFETLGVTATPVYYDIAPPYAQVAAVDLNADAETEVVTSIERHGVTVNFNQPATVFRFWNGDVGIVAAQGLQITSITPESAQIPMTGYTPNPAVADAYEALGLRIVNGTVAASNVVAEEEGWDDYAATVTSNPASKIPYNPAFNIDPGMTGAPLDCSAPAQWVKGRSVPGDPWNASSEFGLDSNRANYAFSAIYDYVPITVVSAVPKVNSIRPPLKGWDGVTIRSEADGDTSIFPTLNNPSYFENYATLKIGRGLANTWIKEGQRLGSEWALNREPVYYESRGKYYYALAKYICGPDSYAQKHGIIGDLITIGSDLIGERSVTTVDWENVAGLVMCGAICAKFFDDPALNTLMDMSDPSDIGFGYEDNFAQFLTQDMIDLHIEDEDKGVNFYPYEDSDLGLASEVWLLNALSTPTFGAVNYGHKLHFVYAGIVLSGISAFVPLCDALGCWDVLGGRENVPLASFINRMYWLRKEGPVTSAHKIPFTDATGSFAIGQTVIGTTSGATGTIRCVYQDVNGADGLLIVDDNGTDAIAGETIAVNGVTATTSGNGYTVGMLGGSPHGLQIHGKAVMSEATMNFFDNTLIPGGVTIPTLRPEKQVPPSLAANGLDVTVTLSPFEGNGGNVLVSRNLRYQLTSADPFNPDAWTVLPGITNGQTIALPAPGEYRVGIAGVNDLGQVGSYSQNRKTRSVDPGPIPGVITVA